MQRGARNVSGHIYNPAHRGPDRDPDPYHACRTCPAVWTSHLSRHHLLHVCMHSLCVGSTFPWTSPRPPAPPAHPQRSHPRALAQVHSLAKPSRAQLSLGIHLPRSYKDRAHLGWHWTQTFMPGKSHRRRSLVATIYGVTKESDIRASCQG